MVSSRHGPVPMGDFAKLPAVVPLLRINRVVLRPTQIREVGGTPARSVNTTVSAPPGSPAAMRIPSKRRAPPTCSFDRSNGRGRLTAPRPAGVPVGETRPCGSRTSHLVAPARPTALGPAAYEGEVGVSQIKCKSDRPARRCPRSPEPSYMVTGSSEVGGAGGRPVGAAGWPPAVTSRLSLRTTAVWARAARGGEQASIREAGAG